MKHLLDGKRALVTGCHGRLGPVWMEALAAAGARVYGTDLPKDISDLETVNRLVDEYPDIDILVNNAGIDSRPTDGPVCLGEPMLSVNVYGTSLMIEKFAASMMGRGGGTIINIASLYGLVAPDLRYYSHRPDGWFKDPMYGATKAAIIQLTRTYAAYYAALGIRVNALAPGGVVDDRDSLTAQDPAFAKKYTARIPMGRMATPADLGGPLVFLASDMSRFVTGHTLPIEGGYLAW
jgi:NAD(P)-dependent dehydrogenase (short-subunit alcohol dehydrogenase family)